MSTKLIAWLTGTLTLLLTLFSFVLSFNALADLAANHSVSIPPLFPLVVEAGVVIFSLNALYRSLHGESATWQWGLIIGSSLLAGLFNILHAETDLISRAIAAMPSLFLLLSFETFLSQIKHAVKRSHLVKSVTELQAQLHASSLELDNLATTKQTELDTLSHRVEQLHQEIEQSRVTLDQLHQAIAQAKTVSTNTLEQAQEIKAKRDALAMEQRRHQLLHILTTEGDLGPSALADRLHASRGTVYSDLKALSEAGQIIKNGVGWEVIR